MRSLPTSLQLAIVVKRPIRSSERQAQSCVCAWVRNGQLNPWDLISAEYPITEIAAAYPESVARKHIKTIFRYSA